MTDFRCGTGFDAHAYIKGRKLILGGVEVIHHMGLAGHSDADVLTHAVIDALLGAAGLGDIGRHFPDSDEEYRDIRSLDLLERVREMLEGEGWKVANIDATLIAQQPRLAEYIEAMTNNLAAVMRLEPGRINIKATTTEKMGFTGREEGLAAMAAAALYK